jgi:hypothetical protein
MIDRYHIGRMTYGPRDALELRKSLIALRDAALGPETFDPNLAVTLSHTIALLAALIIDKWPAEKNFLEEG